MSATATSATVALEKQTTQILGEQLFRQVQSMWDSSDYLTRQKALISCRKAVEQGYLRAHWRLGMWYQYDGGNEINHETAFAHYFLGARNNDSWCLHRVGRCYELGVGVSKDLSKAIEYYQLAIDYDQSKDKIDTKESREYLDLLLKVTPPVSSSLASKTNADIKINKEVIERIKIKLIESIHRELNVDLAKSRLATFEAFDKFVQGFITPELCKKKIPTLNLWGIGLVDSEISELAKLLGLNPDLETLNLWGNEITQMGSDTLANILTTNTKLKSLNLGGNYINKQAIEKIINARTTGQFELGLWSVWINPEIIGQIKKNNFITISATADYKYMLDTFENTIKTLYSEDNPVQLKKLLDKLMTQLQAFPISELDKLYIILNKISKIEAKLDVKSEIIMSFWCKVIQYFRQTFKKEDMALEYFAKVEQQEARNLAKKMIEDLNKNIATDTRVINETGTLMKAAQSVASYLPTFAVTASGANKHVKIQNAECIKAKLESLPITIGSFNKILDEYAMLDLGAGSGTVVSEMIKKYKQELGEIKVTSANSADKSVNKKNP